MGCDVPSSVEQGADSAGVALIGAPNTLEDEQQVVEQPAPVVAPGSSTFVMDDETTNDVTPHLEALAFEPTDVPQPNQDGGFWNFEAEDAEQ